VEDRKSAEPAIPVVQAPAGSAREVAIRAAKYFYIPNSDVTIADTLLIPANEFTGDDAAAVSEFQLAGPNSYTNLYVNGIVQRASTYRLSANLLAIDSPGETLYAGTPIIVEIVQLLVLPPP
jgi:hypothetical protein